MMKRDSRSALGYRIVLNHLVFLLAFAGAASAQDYVLEIKPYSKVVGPRITLAEICTIIPKSHILEQQLAKISLGKAAPPSESKDVSLSHIKLLLRRAGLLNKLKSLKGPRIIRVTTAHKDITRLRLKEAVAAYVRQHFEKAGADWRIDFKRLPERVAGPAYPFALAVRPNGALRKGYTVFTVAAVSAAGEVRLAKVAGIVRTFERVAVARRRIPRGSSISPDMVEFARRETTFSNAAVLQQDEPLSAYRSRVSIGAGKIISRKMLEKTPLVSKGDRIKLVVIAGAVRLSLDAVAQEAGNYNDLIRVWSRETKRVLQGRILEKGKVRLEL